MNNDQNNVRQNGQIKSFSLFLMPFSSKNKITILIINFLTAAFFLFNYQNIAIVITTI